VRVVAVLVHGQALTYPVISFLLFQENRVESGEEQHARGAAPQRPAALEHVPVPRAAEFYW
jgi:hypothetical protein